MTIYQEAHSRIDQFPEETVLLFVRLMDKMDPSTMLKNEKKTNRRFIESAGTLDIDEDAVNQLREASMA